MRNFGDETVRPRAIDCKSHRNSPRSCTSVSDRNSGLSKQTNVDQTQLFAAIDSVGKARTALEKANIQMLLQIRQQMERAQITKLEQRREWREVRAFFGAIYSFAKAL